jgi:hypothetical protein
VAQTAIAQKKIWQCLWIVPLSVGMRISLYRGNADVESLSLPAH